MADYGLYNSLRGFLGTGEQKMKLAQQEQETLYKEEQLRMEKEQINVQYAQQYEDYMGAIDESVNALTVQGQEDIQRKALELQDGIREDLAKYNNNYSRWLARGGYAKLREYKSSILGSEEYKNHATSKATVSKILQAKEDKMAHLIPQSTMRQLGQYQNGESNLVTWNGLLGEVDLEGLEKTIALGQSASVEQVMGHNTNSAIFLSNYMLEMGMDKSDLEDMTPEKQRYFYSGLQNYVARQGINVRGTAKGDDFGVSAGRSAVNDFKFALHSMPSVNPGYDILDDLQNNVQVKTLTDILGIDYEANTGYDDKWWWQGSDVQVKGYGVANSLHESFYKSTFHSSYGNSPASSENPGEPTLRNVNMESLYDSSGRRVQEGGMIEKANPAGVFLAYKADSIVDGDYSGSQLLVERVDMSDKERKEMVEAGRGEDYKPTLVIQMLDEDGNYFFKEVSKDAISTAIQDKELGVDKSYASVLQSQVGQQGQKDESAIEDIRFVDAGQKYFEQQASHLGIPTSMQGHVFAYLIHTAKNSGNAEQMFGDALNNLPSQMMQHPELSKIIKDGDVNAFYDYLSRAKGGAGLKQSILGIQKNITSQF